MARPFDDPELQSHFRALAEPSHATPAATPGDRRQPVHTVYGGAHLFRPDVAARLGAAARVHLDRWAPDWVTFARAVRLPGAERLPALPAERAAFERQLDEPGDAARTRHREAWIAREAYARTLAKLASEPVEDYRVDFEDGYGVRADEEEDAAADSVAEALALGLERDTLPPFVGVRPKSFAPGSLDRALRTLERAVDGLLRRTGGRVPANFVVTLPKVTRPAEVSLLAALLAKLERTHGLSEGALELELMIETPESLMGADGRVPLRALVEAAGGRCRGAHLGLYDYTAALRVSALHQTPDHPACAFARQVVQLALAGTGVMLSDGAVAVLPVPPKREEDASGAAAAGDDADRRAVHEAMRTHYGEVRRALREGWYQGWDLHPGQLATRHAAVAAFFLEGLEAAAARLRAFRERAAQASRVGQSFDDAATARALVHHFRLGLRTGTLLPRDLAIAGLRLEDLDAPGFEDAAAGARPS